MRFQSITLLPAVAALTLLTIVTANSNAQTMPAGQVTGRMQSAPVEPDVKIPPRLANFNDIANPAVPNLGHFLVVRPNAADLFSFDADLSIHANSSPDTKPVSPQASALVCSSDSDGDEKMQSAAIGTAATAAWNEVVKLDNEHPNDNPPEVQAARRIACLITDDLNLDAAHDAIDANMKQPGLSQDVIAGITDVGNAIPFAKTKTHPNGQPCWVTATSTTTNGQTSTTKSYAYATWAPLFHKGCQSDSQLLNFFTESKTFDGANSVQYLYNAQQSASTVSGDLLTTTFFPGVQVVLAGAATAGNGTTRTSTTNTAGTSFRSLKAHPFDTSTDTSSTSTTDSVQTALSKLENGGDFNVRVPIPLYYKQSGNWSIYGYFLPNVGFTLNGFGSQQTITESTQYSGNFPLEVYSQIGSVKDPSGNSVAAVAFVDLKAAGEWISPQLAQKISLSAPTVFPVLQASAGVEFAQKFRISLQYIYSTPQFCQVSGASTCASTTNGTTTTGTQTKINGFHLAVSFSPQKSQSSN